MQPLPVTPSSDSPLTPIAATLVASLLPLLAFTRHFRVDRLLVPQSGSQKSKVILSKPFGD